jgi:hypothetical protein
MAKKKASPAGRTSSQKSATSTDDSATLIDTSLAAAAAARLLAHRNAASSSKGDTALMNQLKQANRPAASLSTVLGTGSDALKKATGHSEFNKQVGRNQTYGADVNRTGVPRRTSG